jgi:hypothetical protein
MKSPASLDKRGFLGGGFSNLNSDVFFHPKGKNPGDVINLTKHDFAVGWVGNFGCTDSLNTKEYRPKEKNPGDIIKTAQNRSIPLSPPHHAAQFRQSDLGAESLGYTACYHPLDQNPSDFWPITTKPFLEAHFAVYPEALCERPIKSSCPLGGIVLDPMCGSGTTLVVSKKLGRRYMGIELNPDYCKIAQRRLSQVEWPLERYSKGC